MKSANRPLIVLVSLCAASLLFGFFYILALPLFLPPASEESGGSRVSNAVDPKASEIRVLKLAFPYSRAHPLYQLVSHELASRFSEETNPPLILETYPAQALGDTEAALKGLSKGTIELALIDDEAFGSISGLERAWIRERGTAVRGLAVPPESNTAKIFRDKEIIALAWFPGGKRIRWNVKKVPVFILMSARVFYSLDRPMRDFMRSTAEKLAEQSAQAIQKADAEILSDER